MSDNNDIEKLGLIEKVDAPPFLYSRIEARIQALELEQVRPSWLFALAAAILLLIAVNGVVMTTNNSDPALEALTSEMQLSTSNQLYDD